jgi:hypothetical protein
MSWILYIIKTGQAAISLGTFHDPNAAALVVADYAAQGIHVEVIQNEQMEPEPEVVEA